MPLLILPLVTGWRGPVITLAALGVATATFAVLLGPGHFMIVTLVLLVIVLIGAARWGYGAGVVGAIAGNLLLNFFFVEPLHQFVVQDPRNVAVLATFFATALIGAWMFARQERALANAIARRRELGVMLQVSRTMAAASTPRMALDHLVDAAKAAVSAEACSIHEESEDGHFVAVAATNREADFTREQESLARKAAETMTVVRTRQSDHRGSALRLRDAGPEQAFVPIRAAGGGRAVMRFGGLRPSSTHQEQVALLAAFGDEAAVALHRYRLAEQASSLDLLQRADEVKSAFLGSVSHSLRSPLAGIKTAVGNLRDHAVDWPEVDRAQFLATIETQTDRLATMIESLLRLSTLESKAVTPRIEHVEVAPLLADVAVAAELSTRGRSVTVSACPGLWVLADYGLLFHALMNIVENAARYSRPGGAINLGVTGDGMRTVLTVADGGPAISATERDRVFDRFYRGATAAGSPGSGLGLAIVRETVRLLNGRVWLSGGASGNVFSIELPTARSRFA